MQPRDVLWCESWFSHPPGTLQTPSPNVAGTPGGSEHRPLPRFSGGLKKSAEKKTEDTSVCGKSP